MGTLNNLGQGEHEKQNKKNKSIEVVGLQNLNKDDFQDERVYVGGVGGGVVDECLEAKPQCGLRWRGPCRRSFKRGVQNDAYDAFVAEEVASELEDNSANQMKDEDLSSLETELLDIIKKSKVMKRFAE